MPPEEIAARIAAQRTPPGVLSRIDAVRRERDRYRHALEQIAGTAPCPSPVMPMEIAREALAEYGEV